MTVHISAIVCTRSRAPYLCQALQSLVDQTLPRNQYEVVVVDNASQDNTRQTVEMFSQALNLRYLYEPVLGLSQARNTGWRQAKGMYVAYLDDDAIACPVWLERILDAFETVQPMPGCVGGRIDPIWEVPRPSWLGDELLGYLTLLDWSEMPINLSDKQFLAGANMAFPRHVLEAVGGFQVDLGRIGDKLLSAEEALVMQRIKKMGYHCLYHPEILVRHHIAAQRISKHWFVRRVFWGGVSDALARVSQQSSSAFLIRITLGVAVTGGVILSPRRLVSLIRETNDPDQFALKCSTLFRIGYVAGLWGLAK